VSREKIIDAAAIIFSRSGYHRASMDEIARTAGVAKGTLYYNFPSKAGLFKAVVT
jgi:AcrR family transcriptional regulator